MDVRRFEHQNDGIEWYCERRGDGPPLVLVPSGEGDCASFEKVAAALADEFSVLTFDMPGFSRSGVRSDDSISVALLSDQIAALVTSMDVGPATFYGCSSGGLAVLALSVRHAAVVRKAIVHEAALSVPEVLNQLLAMDDSAIVETCRFVYANVMNDDPAAWEALGADFHERLAPNYVTWVRKYVASGAILQLSPDELAGKPITWTIEGLTAAAGFLDNVILATKAGIDIGLLDCKHFPQVSAPQMLAEHIRANAAVIG